MELNTKDKILTLKVVYYGPALGGKTTNLLTIHALTDKEKRTELISIATRDDRTLFFDLLPMGLGRFFGYDLRLKLFTVPGQVQFDVTRRRVLAGADAIVFVADSQKAQAANNALSLKNLRINMNQNRLDLKTTSVVLQFNKCDLPDIMTVEEMASGLNDELKVPGFPAIATTGKGVIECLAAAVGRAFDGIVAGHRLAPPAEAKRAGDAVRETIGAFAVKTGTASGPGPSLSPSPSARMGAPAPEKSGTWMHHADAKVTDEVDLLDEAVKANIALSERVADYRLAGARAIRREQQVRTLGTLARLADEAGDPTKLEKELLALVLETMTLARGSLLAKPVTGHVVARGIKGHAEDPFMTIPSPPLGSVAERLIAAGKVHLSNDVPTEIFFGEHHTAASGIFCLLFAPVRLADGAFGGLFLYGSDPAEPFDETDGQFIEAACRIVSLVRHRVHAAAAR